MEKEILEKFIEEGLSIRKIGHKLNKSFGSIKYWLNKYNLKTKNNNDSINRYCPRCKKIKERKEFYKRRGIEGSSVYCKHCTTEQTIERMRLFKQKCIDYKGGKCIKCGYDKYNGALEFHHIEQTEKDFTISHLKSYSFDDFVKKELDKCILLCSNCHKEEHGKFE